MTTFKQIYRKCQTLITFLHDLLKMRSRRKRIFGKSYTFNDTTLFNNVVYSDWILAFFAVGVLRNSVSGILITILHISQRIVKYKVNSCSTVTTSDCWSVHLLYKRWHELTIDSQCLEVAYQMPCETKVKKMMCYAITKFFQTPVYHKNNVRVL